MAAPALRPMGIGDILDLTFRLYKSRFVTFLMIALVCFVPFALLMSLFQMSAGVAQSGGFGLPAIKAPSGSFVASVAVRTGGQGGVLFAQQAPGGGVLASPQPLNLGAMLAYLLGSVLFLFIVMPLCRAALTHNIAAAYLGHELGAWESYARALPTLGRLLVAAFLSGVVMMLGFVLCIVPGILFGLWFMLTIPVLVLEDRGPMASIVRSRELMRGNLDKGLVLGLVVWLLGIIVAAVVQVAFRFVPWPHPFLRVFFTNVFQAVVMPIQIAPAILLYYDLRIRKEAFDLQMLAAQLGTPAA